MASNRLEISHPAMPSKCSGFTLVELAIVLVILGALAFVAIPRLNLGSMQVVPVAERIASELRYTQNLALTRADNHTFSVGGGSFSISGPGGSVPLSSGETAGSYDDVTVDSAAVTFTPRFGQPDAGAVIGVSGDGASVSVIVEGETGYVYIQE